MKITKVEVFRLPTANSKQNSPIGCRIHTDAGIRGDGEAGMPTVWAAVPPSAWCATWRAWSSAWTRCRPS